ncbi:c-type cytochrome [Roseibium sp.]|uniref:c-type cytochrome n=1 Tax=Roseibium sp. TaxID=1936156 RepID=UPI003A96C522
MKSGVKIFLAVALIAGGAGVSAHVAMAHGGAKGIVKERMDAMGDLAKTMKQVGGMLRGKVPYDPTEIAQAAERLKQHGGSEMTKLFPDGSLEAPSEAKPEIWANWQKFEAFANDLSEKAGALKAASMDQSAVPAAFGAVGKTCKACHEEFRLKKD